MILVAVTNIKRKIMLFARIALLLLLLSLIIPKLVGLVAELLPQSGNFEGQGIPPVIIEHSH